MVGVDATAFTLAASGLSGAFISAVTGAGTTWTVTANTGIGSGTLGLNQTSAGAVQDTFGNALSGTFTGPVYTISGTPDFAEYRMDEASWNGTAGQVVDSSGSGFNATAVNNATTANVSPAIPGSPGTCSYGEFDNGTTITQGYVAVPDSFPNLTTDFTITAWIRTTNNAPTGQRIFIDDQNNTGGYGFSLADSGSPGRLRFYSRAITPIILDSTFTIANNTWYFVAAVADITNQTRTIYVFNSAGVLQNSTTEPPYTGTWGVDVGPASIGAETNASAEAPINFHFHGNLDEVRVYQKVLSQQSLAAIATQTHPCGGQINNFLIDIGAAAASTCASKNITITARDAGNVTLTGYTGTVSISTSAGHGNWSVVTANGTFTPGASDSGAATYTFVTSDNGVITLALSDTHADDTTVSVVDNSVPLSLSTSATINFRSNVFVITPDTVQVAGRNQATNVALWDQDSVTGNCVINTAYTGSKTLEAWLTRDALDPGGAAPTIGALSLPNTAPASSNLSLTFTNGQANFNLSTTDVGKYVLNMLDNTRAFGTGVNISGASNSITTRPFALVVTAITSGATNNPAGTATGGSKFVSAGTSFQATVGAYLWNSAADTNVAGGDGVPDAGATLAQITANGLASKYAWATTLSAASSYTPATGTLAALNNGALAADAFTGGSATPANLSYPEVGSFTLGVSATSFLNSAGVDLTSANGLAIVFDNSATPARNAVVGRFFPDHFTLTASSVTPACAGGGFTYMDQPNLGYSFTIEARNLANVKTANYINSPTYNTGTVSILAENNNNGTDLSARVSAPSGSWSSGSYNYSTTTATFSRLGPGSPDGPYDALQLGVRVADADGPVLAGLNMNPAISGACGAACTGVVIGATTKVRFGRVTIANAFGSELLALPVPLQVEYYNGSGFVGKNATNLDNCTSITAAMLTPSAGTFASVPVGGGTTSGTLANIPVSAGDAGLSFNAPGAGNVGDFTLQVGLGSLPWLRYDWTGTSVNSDPPLARISFGTYPGSGRQIYIREPW